MTTSLIEPTATQPNVVILRYGELFLKGDNRPAFERLLQQNVRRRLAAATDVRIVREQGRLYVYAPPQRIDSIIAQCTQIFGLSSVSPATEVELDETVIKDHVLQLASSVSNRGKPPATFRITTNRADKRFQTNSTQLNQLVGGAVHLQTGWPVNLRNPELNIEIEISAGKAYVFWQRLAGAGGLPVGVSGQVMLLLSGGIDSPVAGHLMQKRGCHVNALYFHSPPYTSEHALDKVTQLVEVLGQTQRGIAFFSVSFTAVQCAIRDRCPRDLAVVLYRRSMMRIASQIAQRQHCGALVTGENLGQVASQTLSNLASIEDASLLPVLRPLICHDKRETIAIAQRIGTFEISILPHNDCCSLFVPRHPATRTRLDRLIAVEQQADLAALETQAADEAILRKFA